MVTGDNLRHSFLSCNAPGPFKCHSTNWLTDNTILACTYVMSRILCHPEFRSGASVLGYANGLTPQSVTAAVAITEACCQHTESTDGCSTVRSITTRSGRQINHDLLLWTTFWPDTRSAAMSLLVCHQITRSLTGNTRNASFRLQMGSHAKICLLVGSQRTLVQAGLH